MKLAEALIERAQLRQKNEDLIGRIQSNTVVQEGDDPAESPQALMTEYEENMTRMQQLIVQINRTNSATPFDGTATIADAIAKRDCIGAKLRNYREIYSSAFAERFRYSTKEIKFVRTIDGKELQNTIDRLSKEYRELDTRLQGLNWTVELL